mmetsp:Transcript_44455/g.111996  ORF Transcript_44455/g.111996 Transcript_44455/m.111996 type:complete len:390 (-) Transcript_44455:1057-2226(-)
MPVHARKTCASMEATHSTIRGDLPADTLGSLFLCTSRQMPPSSKRTTRTNVAWAVRSASTSGVCGCPLTSHRATQALMGHAAHKCAALRCAAETVVLSSASEAASACVVVSMQHTTPVSMTPAMVPVHCTRPTHLPALVRMTDTTSFSSRENTTTTPSPPTHSSPDRPSTAMQEGANPPKQQCARLARCCHALSGASAASVRGLGTSVSLAMLADRDSGYSSVHSAGPCCSMLRQQPTKSCALHVLATSASVMWSISSSLPQQHRPSTASSKISATTNKGRLRGLRAQHAAMRSLQGACAVGGGVGSSPPVRIAFLTEWICRGCFSSPSPYVTFRVKRSSHWYSSNGTMRANTSYTTIPKLYRSARVSYGSPLSTSGASHCHDIKDSCT